MRASAQTWTSLGLSVLALFSVLFLYLTRDRPGTTETTERARNLIGVWRDEDVRSVVFVSHGKTFRVERAEGDAATGKAKGRDFALYAPDREQADGAAVDRLLSGLGFATPVRRVEGKSRTALGLDKPEATLAIDMDTTKLSLSLGKNAPSPEGSAYVSISGGQSDSVAVVSKEVVALFRMTPDEFRERSLVAFGEREIKELTLERPNATLRLVRRDTGFRIDEKERANRDLLEPVFGALSRLDLKRFLRVVDAEKARAGPASIVVKVTPSEAKARPAVIELGGACPGFTDEIVAIARSPSVRAGCIERALTRVLELERAVLYDEQPFSARADEVETLRIERGGKRLVMTRRGSQFLLREPSEAPVELAAGNQRLGAVLRAPAEIVQNPELAKLGLEPPEGRVVATRIGDDDKAVEETLVLGRTESDGTLYARRGDDGAVLALGRDAARAYAVDATLLKSLRVVDFSLSSLAELELSAPEHQLLERALNGFELALPRGFQHDGSLATDAVLAFGSLTALRFVADADDGSFGFERPTLTASARYDADGGIHTSRLVVGRSTPGGFFAKQGADPSVFVIERTVAERLGMLLVDRSAFMADPKTLARVTITSNGVTRTLERAHDELVPAASSGIDPAVAARVVEAIGALRAEAAVHTGSARPNEGFGRPVLEVRFEPLPGLGKPRSFSVGTSGSPSNPASDTAFQATHFARAAGVDATFIIADAKLKPLFDLF